MIPQNLPDFLLVARSNYQLYGEGILGMCVLLPFRVSMEAFRDGDARFCLLLTCLI